MIVVTCLLFLLRWVALLGSAALSVYVAYLLKRYYWMEAQECFLILVFVVCFSAAIALGINTITTGF